MDVKKYGEFIKAIELVDVFMPKSTGQRYWFGEQLHDPVASVGFKSKLAEVKQGSIVIDGLFKVLGTHGENEKVFTLDFVLRLKYSLTGFDLESIDDKQLKDMINAFRERNFPINAWPYAREVVSSFTTRMGLPTLFIGVLRK
ncbi:MAG: hypothetical protein QME79_14975 [Bacillota bacterium]|nr:hypothetical protein [Bacillota bacterium]